MTADDVKCAREIYDVLGGKSNLISADHCATRLRIVTGDNSKVDMEKLEHIDGVKGVFSNNGQIHLIIGADTVDSVYDEFLNVSGLPGILNKEAAPKEQSAFKRVMKAIGDVF